MYSIGPDSYACKSAFTVHVSVHVNVHASVHVSMHINVDVNVHVYHVMHIVKKNCWLLILCYLVNIIIIHVQSNEYAHCKE